MSTRRVVREEAPAVLEATAGGRTPRSATCLGPYRDRVAARGGDARHSRLVFSAAAGSPHGSRAPRRRRPGRRAQVSRCCSTGMSGRARTPIRMPRSVSPFPMKDDSCDVGIRRCLEMLELTHMARLSRTFAHPRARAMRSPRTAVMALATRGSRRTAVVAAPSAPNITSSLRRFEPLGWNLQWCRAARGPHGQGTSGAAASSHIRPGSPVRVAVVRPPGPGREAGR